MANNIDSLNFEVILDDKKFTAAIEKDLRMAEKLNTDLSNILNLKKRLNGETTTQIVNAEKVRQAEQRTAQEVAKTALQQQKVATEVERTRRLQEGYTGAVRKTNVAIMDSASVMRTLSQLTGMAFSVVGLRRFLSSLIDITGQFEVQRMALRNMLQDVDGADKIFEDLYRFSSDSTYRFSELAKYAKQLAAFNIGKNELLETTKMLGDVASGVGVSMDRLILAYGHVKSSGFLRGIQLRSFSQNGVPILEELSKMFTEIEGKAVSLGDVFDKMTKREIPFEMVEEAFRRMTSEGGKFYQMQEVLAKTLSGQINILKGRWENMLAAVGQSQAGLLKGAVGKVSDLIADYEEFGKVLAEVIAVIGAYRAGVILATIATDGLTAATNVGLAGAMKNMLKWIASNPWAFLAAGVTFATIEIVKWANALTDSEKITKALTDVTNEYNRASGTEIAELDALFAALKNAKKGTDEYTSAKLALEKRFDPYIQQLRAEGVEVSNLTTLYEGLTEKILSANKQKFLETAQKDITDTYSDIVNDVRSDLDNLMREKGGLSADQKGSLWHYLLTGEKNEYYNSINGLDKGVRKSIALAGGGSTSWEDDKTVQSRLDALRQRIVTAGDTYAQSMADAAKTFDFATKAVNGSVGEELSGWRKSVKDITDTIDEKTLKETGLIAKDDEDYFEYIDRVGKKFKELREEKDKALKVDRPQYEKFLNAIKSIDKALEGNVLSDARYNKTPWLPTTTSGLSDEGKALKNQITLLEKYLSIYQKVEPIKGEETSQWMAEKLGGDKSDYENLEGKIESLIAKLRTLGDAGSEAADQIEARLGLDAASKLQKADTAAKKAAADAEKALAAYQAAYDKFDKDWGGDTAGVAYKVDRAIRNYNNEDKKIDKEYTDATMKAYEAHKDNVDKIKEETDALYDLYKARKKANNTKLKDTLRSLADDIYKDGMQGFDLTNWSDKSLSDLLEIKGAIEGLSVPQEIKDLLKDSPDDLKEIEDELKKIKDSTITNTVNPKIFEKIGSVTKKVAGYVSEAADAMERLAEATDNTALSDTAKALSAVGQNLNAAAEGYAAAQSMGAGAYSWIGAIIGGVTDIFSQVIDAIAASNEKLREMRETIRKIRIEAESVRFDNLLSDGVDTVFGKNYVRGLRNAGQGLQEARRKIDDLNDSLREQMSAVYDPLIHPIGVLYTMFPKLLDDIGNIAIKIDHSFWKGDKYRTLSGIADEFGMDVLDAYGNLNPELLNQIYDTYGDLNKGLKDWLLGAAEDSEEYQKAMEQINDATEEIFGNLASDMADQFIDNFLEMGNAVDDLSDTFANLGDAILRSLLQSYILDEILRKYTGMAKDALNKYSTGEMTPEDYAAWLAGFADSVQRESESVAPAINSMIAAFKDRGLLNIDEDTENSLGSGIKGITEDTANLLASYINAMRADLSFIRGLHERGWASIDVISGAIPTLNDYMNQIAANTYDAARNTQSILSELQSVIGSPGTSGMVVRVEAY